MRPKSFTVLYHVNSEILSFWVLRRKKFSYLHFIVAIVTRALMTFIATATQSSLKYVLLFMLHICKWLNFIVFVSFTVPVCEITREKVRSGAFNVGHDRIHVIKCLIREHSRHELWKGFIWVFKSFHFQKKCLQWRKLLIFLSVKKRRKFYCKEMYERWKIFLHIFKIKIRVWLWRF